MNTLRIFGTLAWAAIGAAFVMFVGASWQAVKIAWSDAAKELRELRRRKLEAQERESLRRAR